MTRQSVSVARAYPEALKVDAPDMLRPCVPDVGSYSSIGVFSKGVGGLEVVDDKIRSSPH